MAMTLQEAIDSAIANANYEYGTETVFHVSMHDDYATVLGGGKLFETYGPGQPGGKPTFHPDLPLLDWGPARIDRGLARVSGRWSNRPVPGFSTRGQGGMTLNVAAGGGSAIPVDVSVRRDPGLSFLRSVGLGPSVQIEIEKLSAPGGTATSGVTLNAVEDGVFVRAVGPSLRDPLPGNPPPLATYVVTIVCGGRPG
jgi:hypothetical protein